MSSGKDLGCQPSASMMPMILEKLREWKLVGDEVIARRSIVATTAEGHVARIRRIQEADFDHVCIATSGPDESKFIRFYGEKVLPYL